MPILLVVVLVSILVTRALVLAHGGVLVVVSHLPHLFRVGVLMAYGLLLLRVVVLLLLLRVVVLLLTVMPPGAGLLVLPNVPLRLVVLLIVRLLLPLLLQLPLRELLGLLCLGVYGGHERGQRVFANNRLV